MRYKNNKKKKNICSEAENDERSEIIFRLDFLRLIE